jgi:hypothetical protein
MPWMVLTGTTAHALRSKPSAHAVKNVDGIGGFCRWHDTRYGRVR